MNNYKSEEKCVDILQNSSSLQNFNSNMHFDKNTDSIDYDFYDSNFSSYVGDSDFEVMNEGIKKIQINRLQKHSTNKILSLETGINIAGTEIDGVHESNLTKCIAYENYPSDSPEIECISKSSIDDEAETPVVSPLESSLSTSTPSSELTNVTPFSTSSSCSSVKGRNNSDDEDEKLDMKLLTDAVETLSLQKKNNRSPAHSTKSKTNRPRRKNMTFTNEELRKIDRENERLLKKIMSYTKPRPKSIALRSNTPPLRIKASAAVNRSKQQRQINHDNYILLKRIHNAKPTQTFNNRG